MAYEERKILINMNRFRKIYLREKRSHPDINKKISGYEALLPYKNDPDIYISYTSLKKIGINPSSKYNTPIGIYTYPLKEIFPMIAKAADSGNVPFGGNNPYIWILRSKNKKIFVKDVYKYSSKDYNRDIKKIKKLYSNLKFVKYNNIDSLIKYSIEEVDFKSPFRIFWNITRNLSSAINPGNANKTWNSVLRKLGYTGFADKSGWGFIHEAERIQAVFLSKDAFTIEEMINNIP